MAGTSKAQQRLRRVALSPNGYSKVSTCELVFDSEEALMMPKKQNDPRLARLRQLFTARHPKEATEDDVFLFFKWLQLCHPEMLPKGKHDDSYQDLTADLHGLYHD